MSIEKDKNLTPAHSLKATRASHSAQYCRYQTYSDALKNSFPPELFQSGMVFLLRWSITRLLRSLGHSSFSQNTAESFFFVLFIYIHVLKFWALARENLSSGVCEQQRRRPACASAQSDQRLWYSLIGKYHIWTCYTQNFNFLASPCS